jgi:hypothetical protein
LKDLITSDKDQIRKMRTNVDPTKSFARYMFFTNNEFPIKVEKDDRRLFVSEITQPIPKKQYFDILVDHINDKDSVRSLYDHLMNIDISNVDWKNERPETEFMKDLQLNSMDKELEYLTHKITTTPDSNFTASVANLLGDFTAFCTKQGFEYKTNNRKFGIKIKKYEIEGMTRKRTRQGMAYVFEKDACIDWLIEKEYLAKDWRSLANEDEVEIEEEEEEEEVHPLLRD